MPVSELILAGFELASLGMQVAKAASAGDEEEARVYLSQVVGRVKAAEDAWEASKSSSVEE